jgi:hypothetical protein
MKFSQNSKSRRMRWVAHVVHTSNDKNVYVDLVGNMKERDCLEISGTHKMIILKSVLKEMGQDLWIGYIWLRTGTDGWLL